MTPAVALQQWPHSAVGLRDAPMQACCDDSSSSSPTMATLSCQILEEDSDIDYMDTKIHPLTTRPAGRVLWDPDYIAPGSQTCFDYISTYALHPSIVMDSFAKLCDALLAVRCKCCDGTCKCRHEHAKYHCAKNLSTLIEHL